MLVRMLCRRRGARCLMRSGRRTLTKVRMVSGGHSVSGRSLRRAQAQPQSRGEARLVVPRASALCSDEAVRWGVAVSSFITLQSSARRNQLDGCHHLRRSSINVPIPHASYVLSFSSIISIVQTKPPLTASTTPSKSSKNMPVPYIGQDLTRLAPCPPSASSHVPAARSCPLRQSQSASSFTIHPSLAMPSAHTVAARSIMYVLCCGCGMESRRRSNEELALAYFARQLAAADRGHVAFACPNAY